MKPFYQKSKRCCSFEFQLKKNCETVNFSIFSTHSQQYWVSMCKTERDTGALIYRLRKLRDLTLLSSHVETGSITPPFDEIYSAFKKCCDRRKKPSCAVKIPRTWSVFDANLKQWVKMTRISVGLLVLAVFQLASSYAAPFPQGKITFLIF